MNYLINRVYLARTAHPPLKTVNLMTFIKLGLTPWIMDFNKNLIESVQFRENGDHIVFNLAKNRENTENFHENVKRLVENGKIKGGKLCHAKFYPSPNVTITKKKN